MSTPIATANDSLQQLVACSRDLYSLPRVAMQVLELTDQPSVDVPALRKCLQRDPALTSKVLRVVNSSLFGLPRQVADLNHALTLLGVKPLKMLVLGFSLPPNLQEGIEVEALQQYWRRTIIKAVAAREIAARWGGVDGEELLIAGLLQDMGVLVLLQQLGEPYSRFVTAAWEAGNPLASLEHDLFGFDHTELTSRLLHAWRLPTSLVSMVRAVDHPTATCPAGTTVLWLAELTASFLSSGDPELLAALYQSLSTWKQVVADDVETFLIELQVHVEQLASVYLQNPTATDDYAALVEQARSRIANQSQSLSELLAIEARGMNLDRDQWHDLLAALDEFPQQTGRPLPATTETILAQEPPASMPPLKPVLPLATDSASLPTAHTFDSAETIQADQSFFLRQVSHQAASCRNERHGLSLMLIEIDRAEEMLLTRGVSFPAQLRDDAETWINQWLHTATEAIPLADNCFALLLPDTERLAASRLGRRLMDAVTRNSNRQMFQSSITLSIGVASIALPPKNFDPHDMITAAHRCLSGARLSGGACLKSIEIF